MTINGKVDGFLRADLDAVAAQFGLRHADEIVREVADAVAQWPAFAAHAGLSEAWTAQCAADHRLTLAR
jgi:serine/threonine-protein kinase HipA